MRLIEVIAHYLKLEIDLDLINYAFELNVTEKRLQKNKKHMN
jgi:hypothetical protein